jgi:hypothetical protein
VFSVESTCLWLVWCVQSLVFQAPANINSVYMPPIYRLRSSPEWRKSRPMLSFGAFVKSRTKSSSYNMWSYRNSEYLRTCVASQDQGKCPRDMNPRPDKEPVGRWEEEAGIPLPIPLPRAMRVPDESDAAQKFMGIEMHEFSMYTPVVPLVGIADPRPLPRPRTVGCFLANCSFSNFAFSRSSLRASSRCISSSRCIASSRRLCSSSAILSLWRISSCQRVNFHASLSYLTYLNGPWPGVVL